MGGGEGYWCLPLVCEARWEKQGRTQWVITVRDTAHEYLYSTVHYSNGICDIRYYSATLIQYHIIPALKYSNSLRWF